MKCIKMYIKLRFNFFGFYLLLLKFIIILINKFLVVKKVLKMSVKYIKSYV